MATTALALIDATPEHFDAILRIERTSSARSLVALTEGQALHEALSRGHWIVVAIRHEQVVGWIWFTVELKGGERIGQVLRVAVDDAHRRSRVGSDLVEHARAAFVARGCSTMRLTVSAADAEAIAFFEDAGFAVDAVHMDRPL